MSQCREASLCDVFNDRVLLSKDLFEPLYWRSRTLLVSFLDGLDSLLSGSPKGSDTKRSLLDVRSVTSDSIVQPLAAGNDCNRSLF